MFCFKDPFRFWDITDSWVRKESWSKNQKNQSDSELDLYFTNQLPVPFKGSFTEND